MIEYVWVVSTKKFGEVGYTSLAQADNQIQYLVSINEKMAAAVNVLVDYNGKMG
jgi:hypothetical protein